MNGKFRIANSNKWLVAKTTEDLKKLIPVAKNSNFTIEGLDFSQTVIDHSGIQNIGKWKFQLKQID